VGVPLFEFSVRLLHILKRIDSGDWYFQLVLCDEVSQFCDN
jgi:hypothetical protein